MQQRRRNFLYKLAILAPLPAFLNFEWLQRRKYVAKYYFQFTSPQEKRKFFSSFHKIERTDGFEKINTFFKQKGLLLNVSFEENSSSLESAFTYIFRNKSAFNQWADAVRDYNLFDLHRVPAEIPIRREFYSA